MSDFVPEQCCYRLWSRKLSGTANTLHDYLAIIKNEQSYGKDVFIRGLILTLRSEEGNLQQVPAISSETIPNAHKFRAVGELFRDLALIKQMLGML